jgi:hypothetical protein
VQILAVALELIHELGGYSKKDNKLQYRSWINLLFQMEYVIDFTFRCCLCGPGFIFVYLEILLYYELKAFKIYMIARR